MCGGAHGKPCESKGLGNGCDKIGIASNYAFNMKHKNRYFWITMLGTIAFVGACGGGDDGVCDPDALTGCDNGLVCERVQGGEPTCLAPVVVRGQVFDLLDDSAVAGARIVALDINGAAVSSVAISDSAGSYELPIPSTRLEDGTPVPLELTLRADAAGYLTFPSGLRQSLPIDTGAAVVDNEKHVVQSALTDIALLELPAGAGTGEIYGSVELPAERVGVLVVATGVDGVGYSGVVNLSGEYRIHNLPPGSYTVTGYGRGVNYQSAQIDLAEAEAKVDLVLDSAAPGTVTGSIELANAPGDAVTTVILAVESTFDDFWGRGQTVPGLRAPEPGEAANVSSAYTIENVPAGRYVVLAAFENDGLVRDPDLSIGGTVTLHIEVLPGMTTEVDGFKVTEALQIFGPGADAPEPVTGNPTFSWKDDASEDQYLVEVFNAFGELIWDTTINGVTGADPVVEYAGDPLIPGMYYQFRVTSSKDGVPISRTEDLKGVFYAQ